MGKYLLFMACCSLLISNAQLRVEKGVIIDSISVPDTDNETFALFLPADFNDDVSAPILFVFSPTGNGKQGVQVFKEVAETYNYMVVCSNNARNGPYERNFAIAERLFDHIFSNFQVKEKGIYLAGFSGGSRLVTAIASLTNKIEGVIACGAGFSHIPFHKPSTQDYAYAGICGERDMNFQEMVDVKTYLDKLQFSNTLFTFDGGHRWPPSEQLMKAFDWLEIESVKKGNLHKSRAEILESYQKNYGFASKIDVEERPLRAHECYERLLYSYKNFFTLDSISNKVNTLQQSDAYARQLKNRKEIFEKERDLAEIFVKRFNNDFENPRRANKKWWQKQLLKLDQLDDERANRQMQNMLSRLRFKLFAMVYEKQQLYDLETNSEQRAFCEELYALIYPERFPQ